MQKVKNKTMEQQHRLIKVFRALNQVQLKNYADANGGAIPPMSAEEIELLNAFKTLSAVNRPWRALPSDAEALAAASRLQRTIAPADEVEISDAEKQRFDAIIERQRAQIEELERKIDEKVAAAQQPLRAISDAARPTSPATSAAHAQRSPTSLLFTKSTLRK